MPSLDAQLTGSYSQSGRAFRGPLCYGGPMSEQSPKPTLAESMRRALEAKKAAKAAGGSVSKGMDAKSLEKQLQREAAALNKPAFRRMSHRG